MKLNDSGYFIHGLGVFISVFILKDSLSLSSESFQDFGVHLLVTWISNNDLLIFSV